MKALGVIQYKDTKHLVTYEPQDDWGHIKIQVGVYEANLQFAIFFRNHIAAAAILVMADLTGYPPEHYYRLCRMTLKQEDFYYVAENHG